MSHEIRSPLNGIIGYTEQLMDANLPPIQHRLAGLIQSASSMLLVIVDDILDFSRIEAGGIKLEARCFSLAALIDSAVSIISGSAEEKGLVLRYELDPNLPTLLARRFASGWNTASACAVITGVDLDLQPRSCPTPGRLAGE